MTGGRTIAVLLSAGCLAISGSYTAAEAVNSEGVQTTAGVVADVNGQPKASLNGPKSTVPTGNEAKGKGTRQTRSRVAIIIDDFGNGMKGTDEIFSLPIKLTVAVMPFLPTSQQDAKRAHERGDDVLVHLPMEPKSGRPEWLGPGAVLAKMTDAEVRQKVEAALENVPYAIGINNHMGSKVTGDPRIMGIILAVCKERGLFFVDSKTNYRSVVGQVAQEIGLPRVENHIFLDDVHTASHVRKQMRLVQERALNQHYCVTIGHVGVQGKNTAAGIRGGIEDMKNTVDFIGISDLVKEEWKWAPKPTLP
ncbi:divergent polysaccharide deacetylase family protein [Paenibacillus sp. JW14]|uniref:Divergent polysaccharide deacetylase family protein n=2 Tax=Paenibacillus agri TaxID=2744309 RepID=A0A850EYR6_9BACL|nr:divergent polysaccharide deacetylase family protein [Paenibacillus agri]